MHFPPHQHFDQVTVQDELNNSPNFSYYCCQCAFLYNNISQICILKLTLSPETRLQQSNDHFTSLPACLTNALKSPGLQLNSTPSFLSVNLLAKRHHSSSTQLLRSERPEVIPLLHPSYPFNQQILLLVLNLIYIQPLHLHLHCHYLNQVNIISCLDH